MLSLLFRGRHSLPSRLLCQYPGVVAKFYVSLQFTLPGLARASTNRTRFNNKYMRFSITVKLSKCHEATKTTMTPAKDKYTHPKNKIEVQAHDKMLKTNENNNDKTNEGRVKGDLRIRCQNRTRSAHSHVLCTKNAKTSTHKSKRTVSAVQSRTQLLAHIESKHELSAAHQL